MTNIKPQQELTLEELLNELTDRLVANKKSCVMVLETPNEEGPFVMMTLGTPLVLTLMKLYLDDQLNTVSQKVISTLYHKFGTMMDEDNG